MQVTLSGKTAIVTGAASGIGLATVIQFLESDARGVIAIDVAPKMAAPLESQTQQGRLLYVQGDVAVEETARQFTEAAMKRFGRIDVLVNNAGISIVKALHEHTEQEWDRVMDVNLKSCYWSGKHVLPIMMKQKGGVVLNTGSISGEVGIATQGAYAPSKGALHEMTRQMAIEYAPYGIRVNAICCGTVDTAIVHGSAAASGDPEKYWAMLRNNHPIGRIATPQEVAAFFTFMASDRASFFTGSLIMMDGGYTAK